MKLLRSLLLSSVLLVFSSGHRVSGYETPEGLYQYLATMRRVVDARTISVDIDLGFGVWMHKTEIRLVGVKTPPAEGDTLEQAVAGAKFLQQTLKDRERILLKTSYDPTGKYDGWLAVVSVWDEDEESWVSVNQMLIEAGHAVAE